MTSFSYLEQNQKNDQQWLFCLLRAIFQEFCLHSPRSGFPWPQDPTRIDHCYR
jgi:hypothetical protein